MEPNGRRYDLFISYSTDPDAELTRDLERFLEGFHRLPTPERLPLRALRVCRDGSDFSLAQLRRQAAGDDDAVTSLIRGYLAQSEQLLVVCSRRARESRWVDLETRWFLEQRGPGQVLLAVSEGVDPGAEPADIFPAAAMEAGLHRKPWYDLRGFDAKAARSFRKVKHFEDEKVRLAADLNGHSAGEVQPVWFREQRRRRQNRRLVGVGVLSAAAVLVLFAIYQLTVARREEGLKQIALAYELLYRKPSAALLHAHRASELLRDEQTARAALKAAYKVALLHQHNRRETAQMTGSGSAYLAGRWKQGDVYATASLDGRHQLVVTERGDSGANPPGDVYLVNNESLRSVKLESCASDTRRVEDAAFDVASERIFVSRHYDVNVYDLAGRCVQRIAMSCCTKSPVHLVRGLLGERYAIVAETKGGLWLVDVTVPSPRVEKIQLQREFHADAAVRAVLSADRQRAAVVFESGRAALVRAPVGDKAQLQDLTKQDALFAAFDPVDQEQLVVTGRDGILHRYDVGGAAPVKRADTKIAETAIDDISFSDDGTRLLAAGENGSMYVVERSSGNVLSTIRETEGIDWALARAVPGEPESLHPQRVDALPTLPIDDPVLATARRLRGAGHEWAVVKTSGDVLAGHATYLLDQARGLAYAVSSTDTQTVESQGELIWLKSATSFMSNALAGPVLRVDGGAATYYPARDVWVSALAPHEGIVYLGTSRGLYALKGSALMRISRPTWDVRGLYPIDSRLWVTTGRQGGYVIDHGRLYRVTEPFARIRSVKVVDGRIWMLSQSSSGDSLQLGGPAYRVDGYLAQPLPHSGVAVADVVLAAGRVWLAGQPGLYVVDGLDVRPVPGISEEVTGIEAGVGGLEVSTKVQRWPYADGPRYLVDPQSLAVRKR
ncbi:TIR domain-containing protein [Variovorax sp. J22P240]|uniref:TIR domain-containing protein n=1 Tax=Variovorax sp. J22P240 TaxID=3053514 RepID=UPI0025782768|nr:TIR domain-containing protein [Variovorax sp. J22P240]MDM0001832.1 TIR domain-containing protein [Variovorax sp. J22P240]